MDANRFYSASYDMRFHYKMRGMRTFLDCATPDERMAMFGRCHVLLAMLYESGNDLTFDDEGRRALMGRDALDFENDWELDDFVDACAESGFINAEKLALFGKITSDGVQEQIDYRDDKSEMGKRAHSKTYLKRCAHVDYETGEVCDAEFYTGSPNQKYCDACRMKRKAKANAERQARYKERKKGKRNG